MPPLQTMMPLRDAAFPVCGSVLDACARSGAQPDPVARTRIHHHLRDATLMRPSWLHVCTPFVRKHRCGLDVILAQQAVPQIRFHRLPWAVLRRTVLDKAHA